MDMAGEAENRMKRQWAVRKAGQTPGNLSPVYGVLRKVPRAIPDPKHPSAFGHGARLEFPREAIP